MSFAITITKKRDIYN